MLIDLIAKENFAYANGNFTSEIYQVMSKSEGNIFVSPLGLQLVLFMFYLGSRGKTQEYLPHSMHMGDMDSNPRMEEAYLDQVRSIIEKFEKLTDFTFINQLFLENSYNVKESFKKTVHRYFRVTPEGMNFVTQPEPSRVLVNKWISQKSNNKINDLLPHGFVDHATHLMMLSIASFKYKWFVEFSKDRTATAGFHYISGSWDSNVTMMHRAVLKTDYTNEFLYHAVRLPYKDNDFSMLILLPKGRLSSLEQNLPSATEVLNEMRPTDVYVQLPKFKIEMFIDPKETLLKKHYSYIRMFTSGYDFSGITDKNPDRVFASKFVHKSFIEVDEEGAVSEEDAMKCKLAELISGPIKRPIEFFVNQPFIFYILHQDIVVFIGRYIQP